MNSSATSDLYRDVVDFAHITPSWVQFLAEVWTEAGLLLFGGLFAAIWWTARPSGSRAVAVAVLAPLATALAYACSESFKSVIDEERPCRAVTGVVSLIPCPPVGDWSFPSNHSTIAGAAAITLALARPVLGWLTVPMALLMAFSRVFVGVHYPHDVAAGLLMGAVLAALVVRLATRPVQLLVETMRLSGTGAALWLVGPGGGVPAVARGQHSAERG
jgi:membrane-associated phospholipid phosphatase